MTSLAWLKFWNWLILISALVQAFTGATQFFYRPNSILQIHMINGPIFVALILVHLGYNWGWVRSQMLRARRNMVQPRKPLRETSR
ncbi:MAG: hypothetical protein ACM3OC_04630 [Deltaproteobacteria bacterium]